MFSIRSFRNGKDLIPSSRKALLYPTWTEETSRCSSTATQQLCPDSTLDEVLIYAICSSGTNKHDKPDFRTTSPEPCFSARVSRSTKGSFGSHHIGGRHRLTSHLCVWSLLSAEKETLPKILSREVFH